MIENNLWTNEFYEKAYDNVKEKWPIVIPSVNRPNPIIFKKIISKFNDDFNYPVIFIVRKSQKNEYKEFIKSKFVKFVSTADENIDCVGKTRQFAINWLNNNGYKFAFCLDDDIPRIGHCYKKETSKGNLISSFERHDDPAKVFAMWQLSMEQAVKHYNCMMSGIVPSSNCWYIDNVNEEKSLHLLNYSFIAAVCWNIELMKKNKIIYESDDKIGFDDKDILIKIVEKKGITCTFPFISYEFPKDVVSVDNYNFDTIEERFNCMSNVMFNNHSDKNWVKFYKDKNGISKVSLRWHRIRKMYDLKECKFNIWKEIKPLLK